MRLQAVFMGCFMMAPFAAAQQAQGPQPIGTDHFCGLDDTNAPATLQNCESQNLLNTETNVLGTAVMKRHGFIQSASLSVATAPVTGAYWFIDKNGNSQVIVCQDINCAHSVNGGSFSIIYSTATAGVLRWSFTDYNGIVYAVDDKADQPWSYDGTTFTIPFSSSNVPQGTLIEQSKDRLIISGVPTNPSGVYYSQSGVFTNFNTSGNSADPWLDNIGTAGDKITALKYDSGNLYIFKRNSITLCILADQFSTVCYPIASTIGTSSPNSVVSAPDGIYFQSQTGAYWRIPTYGLYGLELISKKISNFVRNQPSQFGNVGSNFQGSVADWNAGTQTPANSFNTITHVGSIFNSSSTFNDTFSSGTYYSNIDTSTIHNSVILASTTASDIWSASTSGALNWTIGGGNYVWENPGVATTGAGGGSVPNGGGNRLDTSQVAYSSGSWSITVRYSNNGVGNQSCGGGGTCFEFRYADDGTNYKALFVQDFNTSIKKIGLLKYTSGSETILASSAQDTGGVNVSNIYTVLSSTSGTASVYFNGVFLDSSTDATSITPTKTEIGAYADNSINTVNVFTNFSYFAYDSSGTYQSPIFDTQFSTPIWGPLSSTFTATNNNNQFQVDFYARVSTSPNNDQWDAYIASSDTIKMTNAPKRYVQYKANLFAYISTVTPQISAVSLPAATTGQFVTQCVQPGANITSWSGFVCDTSNNMGLGSEVFYATSAVSCASLPTNPPLNGSGSLQNGWTLQTNKTALTISTNSAVIIGWNDLMTSATDQAQINSCQLSWANGVNPQPVWGVYDPIKNAIYWTTSDYGKTGTQSNDRVLKYDLNIAGNSYYFNQGIPASPWFPWNLNATALRMINNLLYFGSSTNGTWDQYGASGTQNDNGSAVNGYWQSKDFSCNAPFLDSTWGRIYAVARNKQGGTITQTMTSSLNSIDLFSISTSTSAAQNYVRSTHQVQNFTSAPFANVEFSDASLNNQWEIDGLQLDCIPNPPMDENP